MAHAGEAKPETKAAEEAPEPLNCKTWAFRVSLHCEGCRKKVDKILRRTEGVYRTETDLKQQRVVVVGNVEAETVIARLEKKTGKRPLLLLPDNKGPAKASAAAPKEKKQSKPDKPKENQASGGDGDGGRGEEGEGDGPKGQRKAPKGEGKALQKTQTPEKADGAGNAGSSSEKGEGTGEKDGGDGDVAAKEGKEQKPDAEAKHGAAVPAGGEQTPVPEKQAAEKVGEPAKSAGGVGGKKKKSKAKNGNNEGSEEGNMGQEGSSGPDPVHGPSRDVASHFPVHQQFAAYPHPSPYPSPYYHGPPMYAIGYHNAYPTTSYGAAYYTPQPPPNSYTYVHPGPERDRGIPRFSDPYSHQPSDSFEMFSDENPNACSIM